MGGQLGLPLPGEHALEVHPGNPPGRLRGPEVAHVPHMLADDEGLFIQQFDIAGEHLLLILLGKHERRMGVHPGDGIRAKLGQDQRARVLLVNGVKLLR